MRYLVILVSLVLASCSSQKENKQEKSPKSSAVAEQVNPIIKSIQEAHKLDAFMQEKIISFDIKLIFGGNERLNARIYSTTNSSKVLVENSEDTRLLFDGNEIWIHPKDSLYDGARFDVLTWSYFFMAPFKLNDPGTHHTEPKKLPYQKNDSLMTTKLTFGENIGDAPDDWYVVYQNEESKVLEAMAYIVTFGGRDQAKAAQNPHAISYSDYIKVEGIPFAQQWKFWNWSEEEGLQDQLGEATISNIQFSGDASVFNKKKRAVKVAE
ncbi:hypothetical protein SAMN05661096_03360 [Marivirga sericea]|uniref:Outer membrane lipoprotein-sorting protein n=1 Tax=Marivirga sericea TaxID=1028 RepID=A0A1X7L049_9BACT|nr:DUF6503 family protein [Marivirga sericea]SMG47206.1 hypothetical protein SAMN05661096_03360 [Marivirga sericea]